MKLNKKVTDFLTVLLLTGSVTSYALGVAAPCHHPIENKNPTLGYYTDDLIVSHASCKNRIFSGISILEIRNQKNMNVHAAGCYAGDCKVVISGSATSPEGTATVVIGTDSEHNCQYALADSYNGSLRLVNLNCIGGYHSSPRLFSHNEDRKHGRYSAVVW